MSEKCIKRLLALSIAAALAFGAAFAYNAYFFALYWLDARSVMEDAAVMHDIFAEHLAGISVQEDSPSEEYVPADIPQIQEEPASPLDLARELTGNNDIVAYIHVDGTNISNVVLQHSDNDFYLHHDIHGLPNVNGSIFLDYANSPNFNDRSSIIYGHNMRNGTMFHDLRYFMSPEYFHANRYITIITDDKRLTYEIFSAFSTRTYFEYIQVEFRNDYDFLSLLGELRRRSVHTSDISPGASDRILILSTCTNTERDMRFAVAAVLRTVSQ
ncbi:MAG: class B sortase [Defluviitaleaceae bacterium]|nr:class B sortase [Defluviitaleaceae bacterium]